MIINTKTIAKLKPCTASFDNWKTVSEPRDYSLREFITLNTITYNDKMWLVTRLFTVVQNVAWAALCANSVKHLDNYWSKRATTYAAYAAATAYDADTAVVDTTYAATYATYATAYAAAYAAAIAYATAVADADTVVADATAVADAAATAVAAAYAAATAAKKNQQNKNLNFMLEV